MSGISRITITMTDVNRDGVQALIENDWLHSATHISSWQYDVTLRPLLPSEIQEAIRLCSIPHVPRRPRTTT